MNRLILCHLINFIIGCSNIGSGDNLGDKENQSTVTQPLVGEGNARLAAKPCPEGKLFQYSPIAKSDLVNLGVLGTTVPPDHTFPTPHMYFLTVDENNPSPQNIVAPTDIYVTSVGFRHFEKIADLESYTDYDLEFVVCREVVGYFIHINEILHPAIVEQIEQSKCDAGGKKIHTGAGSGESSCNITLNQPIKISAGEVLGNAGNLAARVAGIDMGLRDYRLETGRSAFANPDRFCKEGEEHIRSRCYAVCPLDYLEDSVTDTLKELFRDVMQDIPRTGNYCGNGVYSDVHGTAAGHWFAKDIDRSNLNGPEEMDLHLGPHYITPTKSTFSIGARFQNEVVPPNSHLFTFAPRPSGDTNRKFSEILPGKVYCFESELLMPQNNKLILLELGQNTLAMQFVVADHCQSAPRTLDSPVWFER